MQRQSAAKSETFLHTSDVVHMRSKAPLTQVWASDAFFDGPINKAQLCVQVNAASL